VGEVSQPIHPGSRVEKGRGRVPGPDATTVRRRASSIPRQQRGACRRGPCRPARR
jgi:hypothetical protein